MPSSRRLFRLAVLVYVPLSAAAVLWAWLGGERLAWVHPSPAMAGYSLGDRFVLSLALGLALGLTVTAVTPILVERTAWARALHTELEPIAKALTERDIALVAVLSGFAEELFFRGAMQPVFGLLATSVVFAVLHTGPKRVFIAWSVWAFLMGLAFGWLYDFTGVLWGPVLAHVLINQRNLTYMRRH